MCHINFIGIYYIRRVAGFYRANISLVPGCTRGIVYSSSKNSLHSRISQRLSDTFYVYILDRTVISLRSLPAVSRALSRGWTTSSWEKAPYGKGSPLNLQLNSFIGNALLLLAVRHWPDLLGFPVHSGAAGMLDYVIIFNQSVDQSFYLPENQEHEIGKRSYVGGLPEKATVY